MDADHAAGARDRETAGCAAAMGELNRALTLMGRDDAPRLFRELWDSGRITPAQLREHILDLWSAVEFPCRSLPRRVWMEWFEAVGFVSDAGRSAPTEDLEVWRAQTGRTLGLSWTTDPDKARWFHARNELVGLASTVLHGFAKPEGVLAFCDRRPEREVIVHPRRFSSSPYLRTRKLASFGSASANGITSIGPNR